VTNKSYDGLSAAEKAANQACAREHRASWRVYQRYGNASAFNGYHWTPSDYSGLVCTVKGCGRRWRTRAAYVAATPDLEGQGS
jgi:hypothetical protein